MADTPDTEGPVGRLLDGWDTPRPKPDFADRVLARVEPTLPARYAPRRLNRALTFLLGGVVGGLAVAFVPVLRGSSLAAPPGLERRIHLQAPGIVEVVGEPGSEVRWKRGAGGGLAVEVVQGVTWVRRAPEGAEFSVVAGGDEVRLGGDCGRVEVTRRFLGVDVAADIVDCERVDAVIAEARAELSRRPSR